jgi:uncharacterized protein (DUF2236 family)
VEVAKLVGRRLSRLFGSYGTVDAAVRDDADDGEAIHEALDQVHIQPVEGVDESAHEGCVDVP